MNNSVPTKAEWEPSPADPVIQFFHELQRVAHDDRLLILVSHGVLELLVNTLVEIKCKNGKRITSDSRGFPHSTCSLILNEIGAISDGQLKVYDLFRKLRNRAAHDPLFKVTTADLAGFAEYYREPASLYLLCTAIIGSLWNQHVGELTPRFAPSLVEYNASQASTEGE